MAKPQHLIELNGKLYDAVTGQPVGAKSQPVVVEVKHAATPIPAPKAKPPKSRHHTLAVNQAHKQPQKSHTLMRTAVKKPHHKHPAASQAAAPSVLTRLSHIPHHRLQRSATTSRSTVISRFGQPGQKVPVTIAPIEVRQGPESTVASRPALLKHHQAKLEHHTASHSTFEKALHNATSHQQKRHPKVSTARRFSHKLRTASLTRKVATSLAAGLLLGGFYTYQSLSQLSLQVVSARSGVSAVMPSYRPAGFSLSRNIEYSPGLVNLKYESNSDGRSFVLTQQETAKDSQTLLRERLPADADRYYTIEQGGRTLFMMADNRVAWLDSGTWYEIKDNASLSSDQLLRLIASL